MMRRREFIAGLGSAAAWPLAVRAQHSAMPVIGYLSTATPELYAERLRAFRNGLGETGFIEGQNLTIEYGWANGNYDRLPALAADMVRRHVSAIVSVGGIPAALVAKAATTTIPVIFLVGGDPVTFGLAASLNRPGGNLTGASVLTVELGPKKLELLHELIPRVTNIAMLVNQTNPAAATDFKTSQEAARKLGIELLVHNATTESEIDAAFMKMRTGGLLIAADLLFNNRMTQIASLTTRYAIPAVQRPEFAEAGGLIGYGPDLVDTDRLVGVYTGRVLKGEKPGDLPIQQITKVKLVINMKTAKALNLIVPESILVRADEVIE
jgi:putative ABC transport system substrate-binding protein